MDRKIKFKFWLAHTKKITYEHYLSEVHSIIPYFTPDITTLQFTGLKDMNGKEIYEGDIVATHCYNKDQKHFVEWTREGWMAGGYHLDAIYYTGSSKFKVIGNIYENATLVQ